MLMLALQKLDQLRIASKIQHQIKVVGGHQLRTASKIKHQIKVVDDHQQILGNGDVHVFQRFCRRTKAQEGDFDRGRARPQPTTITIR